MVTETKRIKRFLLENGFKRSEEKQQVESNTVPVGISEVIRYENSFVNVKGLVHFIDKETLYTLATFTYEKTYLTNMSMGQTTELHFIPIDFSDDQRYSELMKGIEMVIRGLYSRRRRK